MIGVGRDGPVGIVVGQAADARVPEEPTAAGIGERQALAVLTTVDGLGPATLAGLLTRFGTAIELLAVASSPSGMDDVADHGEALRSPRAVSTELAAAIVNASRRTADVLGAIDRAGVSIVSADDPAYPARLRAIELPPHVLFVRGDPDSMSGQSAIA